MNPFQIDKEGGGGRVCHLAITSWLESLSSLTDFMQVLRLQSPAPASDKIIANPDLTPEPFQWDNPQFSPPASLQSGWTFYKTNWYFNTSLTHPASYLHQVGEHKKLSKLLGPLERKIPPLLELLLYGIRELAPAIPRTWLVGHLLASRGRGWRFCF